VDSSDEPLLRIGELGRRVGLSDHVLRSWESRYGLLRPERSTGGFRLYSQSDEQRVRTMQQHLSRGLSAAEAARATLAADRVVGAETPEPLDAARDANGDVADAVQVLAASLEAFDEPGAQAWLDRLLASLTVETVLRDVVLPYLRALGTQWEQGLVGVAQEHFASNLLRGRLAAMARGWGQGRGSLALLACPPGEQHDLPLLIFGIVLHRNGWRVGYLGPATPVAELARMVRDQEPSLVVLAATVADRFSEVAEELAHLARSVLLAIAGEGADTAIARRLEARLLDMDPVTAAEQFGSR